MGLDAYLRKVDRNGEDDVVCSWRKFNALQGYMYDLFLVKNDLTSDDFYPDEFNDETEVRLDLVDLKDLAELLKLVKEELDKGMSLSVIAEANLDGEKITNAEVQRVFNEEATKFAMENFPPFSGFFFGSYEIDDYYYSCIEDTINQLQEIIKNHQEGITYSYVSWW